MSTREGWRGRFFEDFEVGDVYRHPLGRTITEADNTWFALLTMNTNQLHFNAHYAEKGEFGGLLVNSALTLAIVLGQSVIDTSQNAIAKPRVGSNPPDSPGLCGRYALFGERGDRDARVEIAAARRNSQNQDARAKRARRRLHRVSAHLHGLQGRGCNFRVYVSRRGYADHR